MPESVCACSSGDAVAGLSPGSQPSRRTVLGASAAIAGAAVLTSCGQGSPSGSGAPSSSPSAAVGIVAVSQIPVGGAVSATAPDKSPIVVAQPKAGHVVAFSAICTHLGCTVAPQGSTYLCPCHGSVYDAATGAVMSGPAPAPLPAFPVKVKNGEVVAAS